MRKFFGVVGWVVFMILLAAIALATYQAATFRSGTNPAATARIFQIRLCRTGHYNSSTARERQSRRSMAEVFQLRMGS